MDPNSVDPRFKLFLSDMIQVFTEMYAAITRNEQKD